MKNNTPPSKSLADNVQNACKGSKRSEQWLRRNLSTEQSKLYIVPACTKTWENPAKNVKLEEAAIKEPITMKILNSCNRDVTDDNHQPLLAGFSSRLRHLHFVTQLWGRCPQPHHSLRRSGQTQIWVPISCPRKYPMLLDVPEGKWDIRVGLSDMTENYRRPRLNWRGR